MHTGNSISEIAALKQAIALDNADGMATPADSGGEAERLLTNDNIVTFGWLGWLSSWYPVCLLLVNLLCNRIKVIIQPGRPRRLAASITHIISSILLGFSAIQLYRLRQNTHDWSAAAAAASHNTINAPLPSELNLFLATGPSIYTYRSGLDLTRLAPPHETFFFVFLNFCWSAIVDAIFSQLEGR